MPPSTASQLFLATVLAGFTTVPCEAQNFNVIHGQLYESVSWPATGGAIQTVTGGSSYSGNWSGAGGGTITMTGNTAVRVLSEDDFTFSGPPYDAGGYSITGTDQFQFNAGQEFTTPLTGAPLVHDFALGSPNLPTELLFYIGINDPGVTINGLKYASWDFSTTDAGTVFSVLASTSSFQIASNGTSSLSWDTFGSDNNTAAILLAISNPSGISHFHIETNRLDASGAPFTYTSANQASDFVQVALLVPIPEPSGIALLGAVGCVSLLRRKRASA